MSLADADTAQGAAGVYALYGSDELLLYIGQTNDPARRLSEHARRSAWWPLVRSVAWYVQPTRETAQDLERRLIEEFRPPYNVQHGDARAARRSRRSVWMDLPLADLERLVDRTAAEAERLRRQAAVMTSGLELAHKQNSGTVYEAFDAETAGSGLMDLLSELFPPASPAGEASDRSQLPDEHTTEGAVLPAIEGREA